MEPNPNRIHLIERIDSNQSWAEHTLPRVIENAVHHPAEQEKPAAMSSIVNTLQRDGTEAAYRIGAKQLVKLVRDPLAAALARNLGPEDEALRGRIAEFLKTELGSALIASLISLGLGSIPGLPGEVPTRLVRELRVSAMVGAGDLAADVLMGPLREVLSTTLKGAAETETKAMEGGERLPTETPAVAAPEGAWRMPQ